MATARARLVTPNDVTYIFDRTRGKYLSFDRFQMRAGAAGRTVTDQYLRAEDGQPLMSVGDLMPRDATIVGITANCESNATWTVEIYKKGSNGVLASLPIILDTKASNTSLNVDISQGDTLLVKAVGENIPMPRVLIDIAWRL